MPICNYFKPVAQKHRGYVDLKMLKLRKVIQGGPRPRRASTIVSS